MANNTWSVDGFQVSNLTPESGTVQCESLDTGLVATGSSHTDALALVSSSNLFATVASSTGCKLPAVVAKGAIVRILNGGANVLTVYPPSGGKINGGSADAADASTVAAVSGGVPGKLVYQQDGTLTNGVPNYLRIG